LFRSLALYCPSMFRSYASSFSYRFWYFTKIV